MKPKAKIKLSNKTTKAKAIKGALFKIKETLMTEDIDREITLVKTTNRDKTCDWK